MLAIDAEESRCLIDLPHKLLLDAHMASQERERARPDELDALLDRRMLLQLYLKATSEKHLFWYVALLNERDSMFYKNFEHKMLLIDKDGSQSQASTSARLHERGRALGTQSSGHG